MQVVNFQFDTWVLNVHGKLPDNGIAEYFDKMQQEAREQEEDVATEWTFDGQTMYIKPHGAGRQWRWLIYCGQHYLHVDIGKGKFNGIMAKVRCSSQLLHEQGPDGALSKVYAFLTKLFDDSFWLQVGELHLCCDIAGWDLTIEDAQAFVTRGRSKKMRLGEDEAPGENEVLPEVTFTGRRVTQFDFSKTAPHSCCIYDKTKEVQVHHKEWFHEIWKGNGWDGVERVVRVEFRYERECLHEMGIEDAYDSLDRIMSLWAYSTQKWLRHTLPDGDQNQSRWATSDVWGILQNPGGVNEAVPAVREKKVELDAERAKAGFVGYATSWALREVFRYEHQDQTTDDGPIGLPLHAVDDDGGGFLAWAFDPVRAYLTEHKESTFVRQIQHKAQKLGLALAA